MTHSPSVAVMFKNMGRQAFGKLQAKLFPKYFLLSVLTLALQMGTLKFALPVGLQSGAADQSLVRPS